MPWVASIAIWARLASMSCRQSRLSKEMEAFISRIRAEGPSANRPPHIALESLSLRPSIASLLSLSLGLALAGCDGQKAAEPQGDGATPANAGSARTYPTGRLDRSRAGTPAPAVTFEDPQGRPVNLAAFRGKPLLVNLWATWCAPCVVEMPTLDALAEREERVQLLAISMDPDGRDKVTAFFEERNFGALEPYLDNELKLMPELGVSTLPTTILYDPDGREIWRMTGMED